MTWVRSADNFLFYSGRGWSLRIWPVPALPFIEGAVSEGRADVDLFGDGERCEHIVVRDVFGERPILECLIATACNLLGALGYDSVGELVLAKFALAEFLAAEVSA